MTDELSTARARYVAELHTAGVLADPAWWQAFTDVPRHVFVPRFFQPTGDGRWQAIDDRHPDYLRLVYSDTALTTQLDGRLDPRPGGKPVDGTGTSSSSQPALMAYMLHALNLTGGEWVREVGTGTGYNAALLCHRLGDERVNTVEIDPVLVHRAQARLATAGYLPTIVAGDATEAGRGSYDRLIATCSVPHIPRSWITSVCDGGLIVASLWRNLGGGPLARLEVAAGSAQGYFLPQFGGFMPTRSQQPTAAALGQAVNQIGISRAATTDGSVIIDEQAGLWIALLVPDVAWLGLTPDTRSPQLWLFAPDGSWAMLDEATMRVEQYGPRLLWDEVEQAYTLWQDHGKPARDRLGLTVTADGTHRFWLDHPGNPVWTDPPAQP